MYLLHSLTRSGTQMHGLGKVNFDGLAGNVAMSIYSYFSNEMTNAPEGVRLISSGRSRRGLYDGKDIRTGNNVSFSERKTRRKFKPNVFKKRVYSELLDEMVRFHLTTSTLRSIDKVGGLDNYLLTSKHVTSGEGLATKERILKKIKMDEQVLKNREYQHAKLIEKLQSQGDLSQG